MEREKSQELEYNTGVMWEYDHARPLDVAEYKYYELHLLPFGWGIISAPYRKEQGEVVRIGK